MGNMRGTWRKKLRTSSLRALWIDLFTLLLPLYTYIWNKLSCCPFSEISSSEKLNRYTRCENDLEPRRKLLIPFEWRSDIMDRSTQEPTLYSWPNLMTSLRYWAPLVLWADPRKCQEKSLLLPSVLSEVDQIKQRPAEMSHTISVTFFVTEAQYPIPTR